MGREIKFRAWNATRKKMLFDFTMSSIGIVYYLAFGYIVGTYQSSDVVLMQYTGLKDRKGTEIYEGDICIGGELWATGGFHIENDVATVVTFQDGMFKLGKISLMSFAGRCEVIGNIYENPELLSLAGDTV